MKAGKIIIAAMLLLAGSAVTPALAASPEQGAYFEDNFLKTLRSTQSPFAALSQKGNIPQVIGITKTVDGLRFVGNDNWHEGYVLLTLHPDGTVEDGEQKLNYPKPVFDRPRHFKFQTYNIWQGYTFVGNADDEIAKVALAGRYTDPKGHIVEFGSDGILRGIGEDTHYYLDNDHADQNNFDFFSLTSDYLGNPDIKAIAFKHDGANLILYPIYAISPESDDPSIGKPDFEHPLLILKSMRTRH
jgi:hypothetical protein